ncbi:hypothetical protein SLEP1_g33608 [Rubroshorea leprosula]|uniref:Small auxin up regulated protein n=1 Tax=Rubroshorea leprosula TaxID=152421 RepID=A0AAV5KHF2_9ROSI|nr:hypothetical protein SLEP1_g33608 [Rubroshorea leprosula]
MANTSSLAKKGHFLVYSADQRRFVLPLEYLKNQIVKELLKLAEEEWGLPGNGLLTLPCDAVFMEYLTALLERHAAEDVQGALLMSVTSIRCSSCSYHHQEAKS